MVLIIALLAFLVFCSEFRRRLLRLSLNFSHTFLLYMLE
ncbi:hypothetical protein HAL07_01540 [Helicobacter ailurogastricus]|uniref:Uncharacterized protein n=1 Tax=Helicobacter ailurogastricus TaxID=1578720 RepID=A0A0K2XA26_9HELI|nr:hypothetical protein HAL011_07710 [Helicobacter ailurogastricus]CRF42921.1 hypothetical protein HAL013_11340 [Helicobacter ailurogastricus]CRF44818.1 hypothetical protein HAL09_14300 [Helicobacter ailurogastricus]CRF52028.1 hypothetical protein HAL07_01540 [Helicobacter ailurogastricus]